MLLALVSRLLIGGLLLFGGAAKLSAGDAFRRNWLSAFLRLPIKLVGPVALAFSLLEVGVGSAFILAVGKSYSAWAAASLLAIVTAVAAVTLLRGKQPACGCTGNFSTSHLSWRLIARNSVFTIAAALVAGRSSFVPGLTSLPAPIGVLAWAALAIGGLLVVHLLARKRSGDERSASQRRHQQWRLEESEIVEG
jgi:hypothetical protein